MSQTILSLIISFSFFNMQAQNRTDSLIGKAFPKLEGNSLAQEKIVFPDDVLSNPTVLVLVFEQKSQRLVNPWTEFMVSNYPNVGYFEVPMISGWYGPFSGWIDGGMRGGVPKNLHSNTVTFYGNRDPYFKDLIMTDKSSCYVFLLDANGEICHLAEGIGTPEKTRELAKVIDSLPKKQTK